jgi:ATP-binding cassette, subfamily B, bacterial
VTAAASLQLLFIGIGALGVLAIMLAHLADATASTSARSTPSKATSITYASATRRAVRPQLDGISLDVKAGESIAIVGPSDSGKTTMIALLMRFYDPIEGRILLDGQDLRTLKQSAILRNIGVVLQDPLLFNETICANIAYGRPGASMAEIRC